MYGFYASMATSADLAGVRCLLQAVLPLPPGDPEQLLRKTGKRVIEGYGLSEASPAVCFNPLDATKPGSVGLPLPDVEVKVVRDDGAKPLAGK